MSLTILNSVAYSVPLSSDCLSFCSLSLACEAVGVADVSKIPDDRMTASTIYSGGYVPSYGRLNSSRGGERWCPKITTDRSDYLQVDMGAARSVCAVATQRRSSEYTKTFYLQFSLDGVTWNIYKENNAQKVKQLKICFYLKTRNIVKGTLQSLLRMQSFVRLTRWNVSSPFSLLQKTSVECAARSLIASALLLLNSSTVEYIEASQVH